MSHERGRAEAEAAYDDERPVTGLLAEHGGDAGVEPVAAAASRLGGRPVDTVSWSLRVAAEWSARFLLVVAAIYVLWRLLDSISLVTIALVVALLITALLEPAVWRLERRGVRRTLAVVLVFFVGIVVIGAVGWFVVSQISGNAATLGSKVVDAEGAIRDWLVSGPLHVSQAQLDQLGRDFANAVSSNRERIATGLFTTASTAVEALGGAALCVLAVFFLLRDGGQVWRWVLQLLPREARPDADVAGRLAWRTLTGYVRGVVVVAMADAVTVTIVLLVVQVPLAVALGVLIFVGAFVPLVGLLVTGTLAVLVTLVTQGLAAAAIVAIAIVLAVQAEGHLLHPMVMSRAVSVHPLAVVVAVTAGTLAAGMFGALIAVPFAAMANTVGSYLAGRRGVDRGLAARAETDSPHAEAAEGAGTATPPGGG
jgi:predicted PurR-regulated permease PerM